MKTTIKPITKEMSTNEELVNALNDNFNNLNKSLDNTSTCLLEELQEIRHKELHNLMIKSNNISLDLTALTKKVDTFHEEMHTFRKETNNKLDELLSLLKK